MKKEMTRCSESPARASCGDTAGCEASPWGRHLSGAPQGEKGGDE